MISELRLKQFRSYANDSFEPSQGVNIIVGPNASGKTNLIEAILMLAIGKSYRVKDSELIQFDKDWARLDARLVAGNERTVKIETLPQPTKSYIIDGKTYKRLTMNHSLPVVLFEPNHLLLLTGGPDGRRSYIDDLLEQIQPGYGALRRSYRRTLAQRNALLKQQSRIEDFFPWNVRLSQLAGNIVASRTRIIEQLQLELPVLYQDLSRTTTPVSIRYAAQWPVDGYETHVLKALEANLETDKARGFTSSGPHREDVAVDFDKRAAQEVASRGETRTAVLALKILELRMLEAARGIKPILLLDDVFSELDGARRRALTEHLINYQTFITTTDADVVLQHFAEACNIIPLTSRG
jgi:DNA replication and repair protein RecF